METAAAPLSFLPPGAPFYGALGGLLLALLLARALLVRTLGADRYRRAGTMVERSVLTTFVLALIGLSFLQIVLRNFFRTGLIWIDPLLRSLVLWIAFFGAFAATAAGRHIAIDVLSRVIGTGPRRLVARALSVFAAAVCAVFANGAWEYLRLEAEFGGEAFLGLRTWQVHSILLFGSILLAYRFLVITVFGPPEEAVPAAAERAA